MPLLDHFHSPFADRRSWEGFHGAWPAMIVMGLNRKLPRRYVAEPRVHLGSSIEIDVATYEEDEADFHRPAKGTTAVGWRPRSGRRRGRRWPSPPTCRTMDEYEVRVYDNKSAAGSWPPSRSSARPTRTGPNTVAPSSPSAPPCSRTASASRSSIWSRPALQPVRRPDGTHRPGRPVPGRRTSSALRRRLSLGRDEEARGLLETWMHPLALGQPLPTLPLWLAENLAVPLELEPSYEETCRVLRIP